jgi:hypothetical protein
MFHKNLEGKNYRGDENEAASVWCVVTVCGDSAATVCGGMCVVCRHENAACVSCVVTNQCCPSHQHMHEALRY